MGTCWTSRHRLPAACSKRAEHNHWRARPSTCSPSPNTTTPLRTTTAAADGSYAFGGLATGSYKVRFSNSPDHLAQWYYFADSPANASDITLGAGSHMADINGYLPDATTSLGGTVYVGATGRPLPGVTVDLFSATDTTTVLRTTTTAADGTYAFTGPATGTYRLRFSNGADYRTQWYYFADSPAGASDVTIAPGYALRGINGYLLDGTMSIAGTVLDANNGTRRCRRCRRPVHHRRHHQPRATTTTSADGSYRFTLTDAGSYLARATGPSPSFSAAQWYYFAANAGAASELTIAPGSHTPGVSFWLTPTQAWAATAPPTITGTSAVGSTLTAVPGTWTPTATSVGYQWYIEDAAVTGATSSTWTVTPAAAGRTVRVAVTAGRAGYPTESTSATTSIPTAAFTPVVPTVSGTARVGATLTANPGAWSPTPDYYTYEWKVGTSSAGSDSPTLVVPPDAVGQSITVTVTGHRAGYTDVARTSTATAAVLSGNLTAPAPTITGTAAVGRTLSANPGHLGAVHDPTRLPVEGRRDRDPGRHRQPPCRFRRRRSARQSPSR